MRKSFLLALAIALLLTGCATQRAEYASGYAGGYYLGDCAYTDLCGNYFYYTPLFPTGPMSPERMKVDLTASHRAPHVVAPRGIVHDSGSSGSSGSGYGSSVSSAPVSVAPSAPVAPPPPPPVHTVSPRG